MIIITSGACSAIYFPFRDRLIKRGRDIDHVRSRSTGGWVKAIILKSFLSQYGVSFCVREKGLNRGFRHRVITSRVCNGRRVTGNNAVESDGVTRVCMYIHTLSVGRGLFR